MPKNLSVKNLLKNFPEQMADQYVCILFVKHSIQPKNLKMRAGDFELEDAIQNIVGIWHDPLNKNGYRFSAEKNGGSSELGVIQFALGTPPLKLKYQISKDDEGLSLKIAENRMKILKLAAHPQGVLIVKSANNNIVSLFKDYPRRLISCIRSLIFIIDGSAPDRKYIFIIVSAEA